MNYIKKYEQDRQKNEGAFEWRGQPVTASHVSQREAATTFKPLDGDLNNTGQLHTHCIGDYPDGHGGAQIAGENDPPSNVTLWADKSQENNEMNCVNSGISLNEWGESSFTNSVSEEGNTSADFSSGSLNPPSRFLSRFSFHPGNISFRLSRGNSISSARSYTTSSAGFTISNEQEDLAGPSCSMADRSNRSRGCEFIPACFANRYPGTPDENCASNSSPVLSESFHDNFNNQQLNSGGDVFRSGNDMRENCDLIFSPINPINSDGGGTRHAERRISVREPVDRNVRFSRTLSVGRLRDRVLRRNPTVDVDLYDFQQDREVILTRRPTEREVLGHVEVESTSDGNNSVSQQALSDNVSSSSSNPFYDGQNNVYGTPRTRETRYRDLLEHRSNFLERRRRIRSQVRALQRLGSRFENLSSHERSCILSGQYRGGHCTCRIATRDGSSNDDANARASISRIVMLAEALFEVLDEIHQQSVVISSRPSVSCIGSVPAPNEVVDSLPLKIFSKLKRKPCDETDQCYICLVEYEDGDSVRVLPCQHEFHRACVDKWLKEIHRVCPLCRGDICRPDLLAAAC
ncbi:RING/U-box superfamily protein [Striga hermonthica]|uniref:RING/U-box superfamily protein n=1 Tax=Striga hermonthica TaxID=68872 RepID=A0A9N7R592_STRHE|nr:RING/U-box superfamily protein [Striga hermonthica]